MKDPILTLLIDRLAVAKQERARGLTDLARAGIAKWAEGMTSTNIKRYGEMKEPAIGEHFQSHFEKDRGVIGYAMRAAYDEGFRDGVDEALDLITAYLKGLS